eukprot:TRINITY_DN13801_c0_g1_i1.p1 TRINITY_DN13801_c0_g1~~TRINITY_DN13801_c0_g1_i1.p1  ORF type:complete len:253 (-),score=36.47 TRINITY_DN13801_c0_g1_i1:30-680(-)
MRLSLRKSCPDPTELENMQEEIERIRNLQIQRATLLRQAAESEATFQQSSLLSATFLMDNNPVTFEFSDSDRFPDIRKRRRNSRDEEINNNLPHEKIFRLRSKLQAIHKSRVNNTTRASQEPEYQTIAVQQAPETCHISKKGTNPRDNPQSTEINISKTHERSSLDSRTHIRSLLSPQSPPTSSPHTSSISNSKANPNLKLKTKKKASIDFLLSHD